MSGVLMIGGREGEKQKKKTKEEKKTPHVNIRPCVKRKSV